MAYTQWYKEMSVYHIWPRSFRDGNGDGIGDLYGVLEKLDSIKSLNVEMCIRDSYGGLGYESNRLALSFHSVTSESRPL